MQGGGGAGGEGGTGGISPTELGLARPMGLSSARLGWAKLHLLLLLLLLVLRKTGNTDS
jgi:hypothetical protein